MEARRAARCVVMSQDASRAEILARALHLRARSTLVISAAKSPRRALEWIAADPPGVLRALVYVGSGEPGEDFVGCFVAAHRRHPEAVLFTTGDGEGAPVPLIALRLDPASIEEVADAILARLGGVDRANPAVEDPVGRAP